MCNISGWKCFLVTNRLAYCAGISKTQNTGFKVLIPELVGELVASGQGCQVPLALLVKHVYFKSFNFFLGKNIIFNFNFKI